jgi:hypothetical protein
VWVWAWHIKYWSYFGLCSNILWGKKGNKLRQFISYLWNLKKT